MSYCVSFSAYIRFYVNILILTKVNKRNTLIFSDVYRSVNYFESRSVSYIGSLAGVHSLCTRSNVVCTSINLRKMKFILYINVDEQYVNDCYLAQQLLIQALKVVNVRGFRKENIIL